MHGHSPGSALFVNAEVDSMGGVVDGGVRLDSKTSPRRAAIEKAQAELRQEFDVREERRRELEFLENGGNPLDFKLGPTTSISVQSSSLKNQLAEQYGISEAKGSFALTASPHGDSVDSSGIPGPPPGREPNFADNLLLFDGENDMIGGERNARINIAPSEQSSQLGLGVKSQAYARRNRSRSSRDSERPSTHGNGSSILPSRGGANGMLCETQADKDHAISSICNSKTTSPNGNVAMELDAHEVATDQEKVGMPQGGSDVRENEYNQHSQLVDPNAKTFEPPGLGGENEERVSVGPNSASSTEKTENFNCSGQLNGVSISKRDENDLQNDVGLDLESCTQIGHNLDRNMVSGQCSILRTAVNSSSNACSKEPSSVFKETPHIPLLSNDVKENEMSRDVDMQVIATDDLKSVSQDLDVQVKIEEICDNRSELQSEVKPEGNLDTQAGDISSSKKMSVCPQAGLECTLTSSNCEPSEATLLGRSSTAALELQNCSGDQKLANKMREDVILKEAQKIEAKRKRVGDLSVRNFPIEKRQKSHWDFVLEEMAWLANDYMQERVWKTHAAAQLSHWVASTGRLKFDEANLRRKQKKVARTLAKAIIQFWRSAEVHLNSNDPSLQVHEECNLGLFGMWKANGGETVNGTVEEPIIAQETHKHLEEQNSEKALRFPIQGYAVRFLKYNSSSDYRLQAEAPMTPDRLSDAGILEISQEDQFSEESLFYTLPPGALEDYRKSVESLWAQYEKIDNMNQGELETSLFDYGSDCVAQENAYEEDEGETSMYYFAGAFDRSKSSKFAQRKWKNSQKSYTSRSYDATSDLPYGLCLENKLGNQTSLLAGKRPSNSLNVGLIPTKRVRTASRQRVVSPFGTGPQGANKDNASSGDTCSFQDDHSSLHGGSLLRKTLEVESTGDFGKQLPFNGTEISTKPKKKKAKHTLGYRNSLNSTDTAGYFSSEKGSTFEQRWQMDSMVHHEQKDQSKKRFESHNFESNGNTGLYGQHVAKKPKLLKHLPDGAPEFSTPVTGSIPSPVTSQMSNMSNSNKLIKMIANRDRGRKAKALKMHAGQSGSGSPWSIFEDQALVVLVHDMGPNWELISDAINSALQFKCIFRKPKECKERHKILMDRNSGDGADSAEDSGTSQAYPTNLPGIPKGSARQLFQRLQGPMEEDIVKAHFEKIILIGHKLHSRRSQEVKQIAPVHNSHILALSQAIPNYLNGGTLTPLDLCEAIPSSPDVLSLGYQGSHPGALAVPNNQGSVASVLPSSGANSMLPGSSSMVLSNTLPPVSAALNAPRDVQRYGVPRPTSLPIDEQQRMQHYSQMLSSRNMQPTGALPVGTDRGVRMLPGGTGMGMMCGMNRGMAMPRPGFQGIGSPAMLNMVSSGGMLSSSGVMMPPSPVNITGQGNSMLRQRDALQMMRPTQNPEDQRQMIVQELQLQATQGNGQGAPPFNGLNTTFSNPTVPQSVQTFPVQHQQHQMPPQSHGLNNHHHPHLQNTSHSPQQQAYVLRLAKERHQIQQRLLHQQHHQLAPTSNAPMPHTHSPAQHPISPLQNGSQIQQPTSSQPPLNSQHPLTPPSPMNHIPLQAQQKQQHGPHGLTRSPQPGGGLPNQLLKQRQRPQLQQQPRHHPQQRQQSQSQQAKLMKGLGRGNTMMHQNLQFDASHVNVSQVSEKSDQVMHPMQGQGLFSGANPGKQLVPQTSNQSHQQQQKLFSRPAHLSPKQLPQMLSPHLDNSNQSQALAPAPAPHSHTILAPQPLPSPLSMTSQQLQRQTSQSQQTVQRMLQQNHQMRSDSPMQSSDQVNPHSTNPAVSQCTDSTSVVPGVSSASTPPSQWKMEPLYDTSSATPSTQLATMGSSPQSNSLGSESDHMPSSSQGLPQRQFSGGSPIHGHSVGGQWQQQRQVGQGNLYSRPTNSGSG
ncbi:chromatin modification-related protein EAF1 B-like isoform X2 [Tasmannia lanceolata]|uniref:chromatin modification-related protein EAF1 B-like isoform X2 n=1 Tax=Tasmannia lanceolata TaxID=3420 RepID=UPI004062C6D1